MIKRFPNTGFQFIFCLFQQLFLLFSVLGISQVRSNDAYDVHWHLVSLNPEQEHLQHTYSHGELPYFWQSLLNHSALIASELRKHYHPDHMLIIIDHSPDTLQSVNLCFSDQSGWIKYTTENRHISLLESSFHSTLANAAPDAACSQITTISGKNYSFDPAKPSMDSVPVEERGLLTVLEFSKSNPEHAVASLPYQSLKTYGSGGGGLSLPWTPKNLLSPGELGDKDMDLYIEVLPVGAISHWLARLWFGHAPPGEDQLVIRTVTRNWQEKVHTISKEQFAQLLNQKKNTDEDFWQFLAGSQMTVSVGEVTDLSAICRYSQSLSTLLSEQVQVLVDAFLELPDEQEVIIQRPDTSTNNGEPAPPGMIMTKWGDSSTGNSRGKTGGGQSASGGGSASGGAFDGNRGYYSRRPSGYSGGGGRYPYGRESYSSYGEGAKTVHHYQIDNAIQDVLKSGSSYYRTMFEHREELAATGWLEQFALHKHHAESLCKHRKYPNGSTDSAGYVTNKGFSYWIEHYLTASSYTVAPSNHALRFFTVLNAFPVRHPLKELAERMYRALPAHIQPHFLKACSELVGEEVKENSSYQWDVILNDEQVHQLFLDSRVTEECYISLLQKTHQWVSVKQLIEACKGEELPVLSLVIDDKSRLSAFSAHMLKTGSSHDKTDSRLRHYLREFKKLKDRELTLKVLGAATGFSVISLTDYKHLIESPPEWQKMMMLNLWRMPAEQAARLVRFVEVPHDPDTWPVTAEASNEGEVWDNILTVLVRHLSMLSDRDLDRSFLALAADNYHFSQSPVNLIGHPWTAWVPTLFGLDFHLLKDWLSHLGKITPDWSRAFLEALDYYSRTLVSEHQATTVSAMKTSNRELAQRLGWLIMAPLDEAYIRKAIAQHLLEPVRYSIHDIQRARDPQTRKKNFVRALQELVKSSADLPALSPDVHNLLVSLTSHFVETGQPHQFIELLLNSLGRNDHALVTASIEEKQKACEVLPKTQDPEFWRRAFLVLYDGFQNLRSSTMAQQENISRMLGTVADPDTGQVAVRRTDEVKQAVRKKVEAVKTQKEVEGVEKLLQEENIDLKHQLTRVTKQMNALQLQQQTQLEEMMIIQEDQKKALEESRQQISVLMEDQSELEKAKAICAVCLGRPQNSYRLKCGHIFCLECINQLVRYSSGSSGEAAHSQSPEGVLKRQCPTCREVFKEDEKQPVYLQ